MILGNPTFTAGSTISQAGGRISQAGSRISGTDTYSISVSRHRRPHPHPRPHPHHLKYDTFKSVISNFFFEKSFSSFIFKLSLKLRVNTRFCEFALPMAGVGRSVGSCVEGIPISYRQVSCLTRNNPGGSTNTLRFGGSSQTESIVSLFITTDKAKTSRGGGKRCRCYEKR